MDVEQANLHQLATEVRVQMSGFLIRMVWLGLVQHLGEETKVLIWEIGVIFLSMSHPSFWGVVIGPIQHNREYALGVESPVISLETWSVCVQG